MRSVVVPETGGPEVLTVVDQPAPKPGPGEILVDVAAAGVNFIDIYHRSGLYPVQLPFGVGQEGAGVVTAAGDGAGDFTPGDRVAWTGVGGSYTEQAVIPADRAVPVPEGVTTLDAAAVLLQGTTAQYLTTATYPIQPGDTAVVHAAAGGVGLLLTQYVKAFGGRVIGTVSTAGKERLARGAGADEIIRYTGPGAADVAAEVRRLTGGAGVPVVYDSVGADTFEASFASLRPRGMLVLFGQSSGPVPPFPPQRLIEGSFFLTRPTSRHYLATRADLLERTGDVLRRVADGTLKVHIGGRYPLEAARQAHEDLAARRTTGKLLLEIRPQGS
jgi:NADPH:quinone reductase